MQRRRVLGYQALTRSRIVAYIVTFGVLLVLLATMQSSFFGRLRPFGAVPDLMICLVLCVSFFCGKYAGAVTGIAAGFLIEALGSQGISLLPVVYMIGGYVVGHYTRTVRPKRYTVYLFYLACALFVRAGVTLIYICLHYGSIYLPHILLYSVLPEAAGTAIAGCVLFFPMLLVCRIPEKIQR